MCKFKFTGGAQPSLQEKKMLSVDAATGNFRYFSASGGGNGSGGGGSGDTDLRMRGSETLDREVLAENAARIVADKFTSMSADRMLELNLAAANRGAKRRLTSDLEGLSFPEASTRAKARKGSSSK